MNINKRILECKYCNKPMIFLITPKIYKSGKKPIPVEPTSLSEEDVNFIETHQLVLYDDSRHVTHFNNCVSRIARLKMDLEIKAKINDISIKI